MPSTALLTGYSPPAGAADEMIDAQGRVRPHWRAVVEGLSSIGGEELRRIEATALRIIRDNGVTYNVYGDPDEPQRPWDIDILPIVIPADEWRRIEAGLVQRALLLDRALADIYGPQRLMRLGVLPPALVHASPQFLRPFHGAEVAGGTRLHLYAADLGRRPDGEWVVLADRTEAPSGAGYALENRIIVSQMLPELFRDGRVERVALFFGALRERLLQLTGVERPHAVLLTPGPSNEAYFEHAYLARYLGFTLVEGEDLTVRDRHVFLKALSGPRKVDLILRRQDSDFCDPLELRTDSALGVPGLADAARAKTVVVANALGSGVVETRALMPLLPRLARELLGEDLKLGSTETYWFGDPKQREAARARGLDAAAERVGRQPPLLGARRAERDPRAAERAALRPAAYWAEAPAALSTAPVEDGGRLVPRPVTLRCFVAATADGYRAMPGGLARVADERGAGVSIQAGAVAKDVWVRSDGEPSSFSLLRPPGQRLEIRRTADDLPSRAADNLFWLGRYVERAEDMTRTIRALLTRLGESSGMAGNASAAEAARRLLVPMGQISQVAAELAASGDVAPVVGELHSLIYDPRNPNGLRQPLAAVGAAAWRVRDRLSADAWGALNGLKLPERGDDPETAIGSARGDLDGLIRTMAAFSGLANENMTRGPNWLFLDLGRRLERAVNTVFLLQAMLADGGPAGESETSDTLALLLEIADSFMTYRSRYFGAFETAPVIDLVLLDESNPRSAAFQVATLKSRAAALPRATPAQARGGDKELIEALHARLRTIRAEALAERGADGARPALKTLLGFLEDRLPDVSNELTEAYFRLAGRRRAGAAPRAARDVA